MNGQRVWKRLVLYARPFQRRIWLALLLLILGTSAELAGPFLAKVVIDNHIVSIERTWYFFEQEPRIGATAPDWVKWQEGYLVREDWLEQGAAAAAIDAEEKQVVTEGTSFYLLEHAVGEGEGKQIDYTHTDESGRRHYQVTLAGANGPSAQSVAVLLTAEEVKLLYSKDVQPIIWLLSGYVGLILLSAGLNYVQLLSLQTTAQMIIQRMRMQIFSHIQKLPIAFFDRTPVGQLVSRVTNDTEAVRELYVSVLATFVQNGIYMLGILTALFILQPDLAVFCLLLVPVLLALVVTYRYYSSRYYAEIRAKLSEMNGTINEMIQNMAIVQAFRREQQVREEFAAVNRAYFRTRLRENNLESLLLRPAVDLIWKCSLTGIIWYFGSASLDGVVTIGVLYAFVDYLGRFFEPVNMIMNRLSQLQQAVTSAQRVFDVLDTPAQEQGVKRRIERPRGEVVFENVSFAYNGVDLVLKNISFTARPGETIALVGHTGSGKSSLMNILLGFYPVTSGRIAIDGIDINEIDPQSLRRHMGLVLQDPFLFSGTIGFNIKLYQDGIRDEEIRKAAQAVKAEPFIALLPEQYDHSVVERGSTLSAGQRQLISFARALAANPAILILDEATASVDSETESAIQEALRVLAQGRTTFMIAHRLSTIQHADQILVLSRGEIVERGTHEELMRSGGMYHKMYLLQQGEVGVKLPAG